MQGSSCRCIPRGWETQHDEDWCRKNRWKSWKSHWRVYYIQPGHCGVQGCAVVCTDRHVYTYMCMYMKCTCIRYTVYGIQNMCVMNHVSSYVHICLYTIIYIYIYIHTIYIYIYTCVCIDVCIFVYIYIYIYMIILYTIMMMMMMIIIIIIITIAHMLHVRGWGLSLPAVPLGDQGGLSVAKQRGGQYSIV